MEENRKPVYKKWWFWVIIVVVIAVLANLGGSSNTVPTSNPKTTLTSDNSNTSVTETKPVAKTSYKVGEIYEDSDVAIKFVAADTNFKGYSKYADVKSGHKVIKADFEFENVGSSDFLASAYDFNCYADGYNCEDFWSTDDSGFSSTLSSGKKTKGSVYFEVPTSAKSITLEYETNWLTSNKVEFVIQ